MLTLKDESAADADWLRKREEYGNGKRDDRQLVHAHVSSSHRREHRGQRREQAVERERHALAHDRPVRACAPLSPESAH